MSVEVFPYAVGDKVHLAGQGFGRAGVATGVIEKIGVKYVHVRGPHHRLITYDKRSQSRTDRWSGSFYTEVQYQARQRSVRNHEALRFFGLEVRLTYRNEWPDDKLEALVAAIEEIQGRKMP